MAKKVAFYTLGCKLNFSETSTISRLFTERGFEKVEFQDAADIYIINTCSVTDNADKKCRKVVKEALKHSPNAYVAIVGCYAQLKPQEISQIPGVDAVLGAAEKFQLVDLLGTFEKKDKSEIYHSPVTTANTFHNSYSFGDRTRTFLKVQDGCDYSCTFCTIPQARGKSRSGNIESVVRSANEIAESGVKEIVLTGVNLGDFGIQEEKGRVETFYELAKALEENVADIERFRISSIEPNLLTDEIITLVASSKKFMPHFHIPLQSGSDKILKLMRRRYLRNVYTDRVTKIKTQMPHCCIGVDVIVGFPGETEADFLETYEFLNQLDISYLHVFPYSERDNTLAENMPSVVPQKERNRRADMLRILSEKKKRFFYEQHIGLETNVLFEADITDGIMEGFTENYIRVAVKYDPILVNETKKVRLTGLNATGLMQVEEAELEILKH
ncbi:tRNA (N(6)-L-threonylcarbamoyladenosine(37)-C(2))-methylthiotransferase MtaB [Adhaeribacter sp. BT258]|uniref:tRNA (N(6)-L-threonylcarbamoyladenosine(37)-C(2))-methylthiotransferase MtaB n=1 Tax=Adhaeribacter terrigena TaxID=2793070 RepID=A0ABS1C0X5_9BACT|nr:tRNA (N(6)-L-threonylcarbamoyladenosine(37)-C(2))-methylthiotransferase MtaB [Adhaeribacter terrigena]MBK0402983.1 tRNA (N(6)-L-threonylcarbamoyladenosine(37)-C(2))-methylthiotransferase MtaB [Adhaeribacter terrigena]